MGKPKGSTLARPAALVLTAGLLGTVGVVAFVSCTTPRLRNTPPDITIMDNPFFAGSGFSYFNR
ncbi:hypothetical protein ACFL59_14865, partial [Planctomycetota bacterium]